MASTSVSASDMKPDLKPKDLSKRIRVIGAGQSRTGTVSFSMALQILLKGPVCHCGSACLSREADFIKKWISILSPKPPNTSREYVISTLQDLLTGYVAVTDNPGILFTEELCDAFPDAIVICTTRDPDKWFVSMKDLVEQVTPWWLPILFLSKPTLRYFGQWTKGMGDKGVKIYGPRGATFEKETLQRHMDYVARVTPPDRLFYFDVKQGWGPLCKILDLPIPDEPFPHANDKVTVQRDIEKLVVGAGLAWLQYFAIAAAAVALGVYALRR